MDIRSDFDGGCLHSAQITGDEVVLMPRPHPFNGRATGVWTSFCVLGAAGRKLRFRFDTSACDLHGHQSGNRYLVSDDQITWRPVDHTSGEGNAYTFTHHVTGAVAWFAHGLPYPVARLVADCKRWLASPWVQPGPSADQHGRLLTIGPAGEHMDHRPDAVQVPFLTAGGTDEEGHPIPRHPLYSLAISDGAASDRATIVVMGGVHPGEHYANHALAGLVDWMVGDSSEAAELRQRSRVLVYPMVNPDGRYGGYTRGSQVMPDGDYNRAWGAMDRGQLSDVDRIKDAICHDAHGPVLFFLDVHNQMKPDDQYMFINTDIYHDDQTGQLLPFPATMEREVDIFSFRPSTSYLIESHNTTAKTWARMGADGPQARYAYTMEPGSIPQPQPATAHRYGRAMGLALLAGVVREQGER